MTHFCGLRQAIRADFVRFGRVTGLYKIRQDIDVVWFAGAFIELFDGAHGVNKAAFMRADKFAF